MMCNVAPPPRHSDAPDHDLLMTIILRMDDKMNRQLTCAVSRRDSASHLARELVQLGFIHEADRDKICRIMEESLRASFPPAAEPPVAAPPAAAARAPQHVAS